MERTGMAVHQEPEVVLAARPTTLQVVTARPLQHVAPQQTGAVAVAVAQQPQVQLLRHLVAMAEQVVHLQSQEQALLSLAVAVAVAVTAATQVTRLPQAAMAEQVVAETVVPRRGTEAPAVQGRASVALSILAAAAAAVAIALEPRSLEITTVEAVQADLESLLCAI